MRAVGERPLQHRGVDLAVQEGGEPHAGIADHLIAVFALGDAVVAHDLVAHEIVVGVDRVGREQLAAQFLQRLVFRLRDQLDVEPLLGLQEQHEIDAVLGGARQHGVGRRHRQRPAALRQSLVVIGREPHQQELDVEPLLGEQAAALRNVERGRAVEARHRRSWSCSRTAGRALRKRRRAERRQSRGGCTCEHGTAAELASLWRMTFLPGKSVLPKPTLNPSPRQRPSHHREHHRDVLWTSSCC